MKYNWIAVGLISGFLPTVSALAAGCATPRNAFDQVYCASNEFSQTDRDINAQYGTLRKLLNTDQQNKLKQGQLAWIKNRDEACSFAKPNGYYVNLSCAINMTQERLSFLKEQERNCRSTGCSDTEIGK
jgi:uncharacterized protein YecT (DUF1311 family)